MSTSMSGRMRVLPALLLLGLGACAELDGYGYEYDDYGYQPGYSYGYPTYGSPSYGSYGGYYSYSPPVIIEGRPRHRHYDRDWDRSWDRDRHRDRDRERTRYDEPRRPDPPRQDLGTQMREPMRNLGGGGDMGSTIGGQLSQVRPTRPSAPPPSPPPSVSSPPPAPAPAPSRTFDQSARERQGGGGGMGSALQGMMGR
ncbi:hypothetical protein [Azospirillum sp.]|uniref:hypothetical protein n=1 Tax=Azospirillum sp. TaxID=34012 RepID=UPI002D2C34DB|nr:hypothetical protein [Azospirillum sp.]HYD65212.1 hypothetical protein [Azospirillum sp.]